MQIDIITENEIAELKTLISDANKIILVGHKSPDGDAIGACLGLAEYLRQQGKSTSVFVPDAYPDFLKWLPGTEKIVRYDKHKTEIDAAFKNADLVFCLDFNDIARLEDMQESVESSPAK